MTHNHGEPVQTETPNIAAEQRARLKELFPEAFTEGKVDFEKLRATLVQLLELNITDAFVCRDVALNNGTAANHGVMQCRLKII